MGSLGGRDNSDFLGKFHIAVRINDTSEQENKELLFNGKPSDNLSILFHEALHAEVLLLISVT